MRIEVELEIEKETKNTIRYAEVENEEGKPPILRTLYIQKWALGKQPPRRIQVTIEEVE